MSARENFMAERIDRRDARGLRRAHMASLDRMAQRAVAVAAPSEADAITLLRLIVGHAVTRLTILDGRHHAQSYCAALSKGDDFRSLTRSLAMAEAERFFAANDRETT